jgi:hypothetical protein
MLLNRRFRPKIRHTELAAIENLCQTSSVDDYEEQFLMLACRCEGLTEAHQVELFVAGLHKSIRADVKLMYPATLEDAMDHARTYEEHDAPEDSATTLVPKGNPVEASGRLLQNLQLLPTLQWHCQTGDRS